MKSFGWFFFIAFVTFGAIDATCLPFLPVHYRPHELLVVDVAVRVLLAGEELREREREVQRSN